MVIVVWDFMVMFHFYVMQTVMVMWGWMHDDEEELDIWLCMIVM